MTKWGNMDEFIAKWGPVLLSAIVAFFTAWIPLLIQRQKDKATEKIVEADAAQKFEQLARNAGDQIDTKNTRIEALENAVQKLHDDMIVLREQKSELERRNHRLENRVKILEDTLRANNIPVPNGKEI